MKADFMLLPFTTIRRGLEILSLVCAILGGGVANSYANARISNFSDITVNPWVNGNGDIVQDILVCTYNQGTGGSRNYSITAIGDGPGFAIKNGTFSLPYSVQWNDGGTGNPSGGTSTILSSGVASNFTRARLPSDTPFGSTDCVAGAQPTARMRVTITNAKLDAVPDGTYTGVVKVTMISQ